MNRRETLASLGALGLTPLSLFAQSAYPSRPVNLVVAFAAGSSSDMLARLISSRTATSLGGQFVIENRPGAGGRLPPPDAVRRPSAMTSTS
jgi:tripartite-type tricarboxylate transporter receptor subunit TctC